MRPLIGIPPCLDERGRWRPGREYHYADASYAEAVGEAGGIAVYLPLAPDADAVVERLDGLLLPGGDDFLPDRPYPPEVRFEAAPARQLAFDRALLACALSRGRPVLGICYGMQLLALHCGGSLHFDLATDLPGADEHRLADPAARHPVRLEPGSRLARCLDGATPSVNSRHHQAVRDAGRARVSARAGDGVVEAIELGEAPFVLGVQWHPETLERAHRDRLFGAFVAACESARAGGRSAPRGY